MACGDSGGVLYRVDVVGIELGPIVVTATERRHKLVFRGLVFRCPACQTDHSLERTGLGSDIICPAEGCGLILRVNASALRPSPA